MPFFAFSDENFYKKEINSEIFAKIKGKSYKDNCKIPLSELNFIHILHIDVKGTGFSRTASILREVK